MYYAHSKGSDKNDWEPLIEHLKQVSVRCKVFADVFGGGELGRVAGLLHDIGKYTRKFTSRLEGARIRVDHSTAGAKMADEIFKSGYATVLQYAIMGHHAGLPNYGSVDTEGSFANRIKKDINDYSAYHTELNDALINPSAVVFPPNICHAVKQASSIEDLGYCFFFLIKMLFSCLVDADFLETEKFMDREKSEIRRQYPSMNVFFKKLDVHIKELNAAAHKTEINKNRQSILAACLSVAEQAKGFFQLTVPTGGGKTLSSMAFAMRHAVKHGMDRIIYVIPYTSIIEQTAKNFKKIFGEENVLEHHSNFDYEPDLDKNVEETSDSMKLASENWDVPIVVTTNVQFFESLYANKTSKSRKIHNIANAVIIFDEAQLLPVNYLRPALETLCELAENYRSSIVLCTATPPSIDRYLRKGVFVKEIIPDEIYNPAVFARVKYSNIGRINFSNMMDMLNQREQVLCIVSHRKLARKIFESLPDKNRYHLSGNMCAAHRRKILDKIKAHLKEGEDVRVVTTQLIEAGVDIDFPVVFRQSAGLDSIIQAAGRCNREGLLPFGEVFVFELEGEPRAKGFLGRTATLGAEVLRNFERIDAPETVRFYFEKLYASDDVDKDRILQQIRDGADKFKFPFRDIAEEFKLIKNDSIAVIVPYDDTAKNLINQLEYGGNAVARKLQEYTVNVYGSDKGERVQENADFQNLMNSGGLQVIADIYYVLNVTCLGENTFYSENIGLRIEGNEGVL